MSTKNFCDRCKQEMPLDSAHEQCGTTKMRFNVSAYSVLNLGSAESKDWCLSCIKDWLMDLWKPALRVSDISPDKRELLIALITFGSGQMIPHGSDKDRAYRMLRDFIMGEANDPK